MIKIEFDTSGLDDLQEGLLQEVAEDIREQLQNMRCEVHGEAPSVRLRAEGDGVELEVTGCCEEFVKRATDAIE